MKSNILKSTTIILIALLTQYCHSAATEVITVEQRRAGVEHYAREILIWQEILLSLKSDCTLEEACAMLLKFDDIFHASTTDTPTKTLNDYVTEIRESHRIKKEVYILCKLEETCALMLKQSIRRNSRLRTHERSTHPKSSTSLLWPSFKNLEDGIKAIHIWLSICQEACECSLIRAAQLILIHQIKILDTETQLKAPRASCSQALRTQEHIMAPLTKAFKPEQAYALCLKYPKKVISEDSPSHECDTPLYVQKYEETLQDLKKTQKGACEVVAKPALEPTWLSAVLAGMPDELRKALHNHFRYGNIPSVAEKLDRFFFLHGYPGVGKTSTGTILAMLTDRPLVRIDCSSIQTKYQSSSSENLNNFLNPIIKSHNPWVVILDELDNLQKTKKSEDEDSSLALSTLQSIMDRNENPNVIFVATSNYQKHITESIKSRMGDGIIEVPLPDDDMRKNIAIIYLDSLNIKYDHSIPFLIASETGGMRSGTAGLTGREIKRIVEKIWLFLANIATASIPEEDTMAREQALKQADFETTEELTIKAIQEVKASDAKSGRPLTIQARKWKEMVESKHFLPRVQTAISVCQLILSGINTIHSIRASSAQLAMAQKGLAVSERGATTGEKQLEIAEDGRKSTEYNTRLNATSLRLALWNAQHNAVFHFSRCEDCRKKYFGHNHDPVTGAIAEVYEIGKQAFPDKQ